MMSSVNEHTFAPAAHHYLLHVQFNDCWLLSGWCDIFLRAHKKIYEQIIVLVKSQLLLASSDKWQRDFFKIEMYWSSMLDPKDFKDGGHWKYNNRETYSSIPLVLGKSVGLRRFNYFMPNRPTAGRIYPSKLARITVRKVVTDLYGT